MPDMLVARAMRDPKPALPWTRRELGREPLQGLAFPLTRGPWAREAKELLVIVLAHGHGDPGEIISSDGCGGRTE
jgi:hypothetical protein